MFSAWRAVQIVALALACGSLAVQPPRELFDPLIPKKVLAVAQRTPSPYPQYTTRDTGAWLYFSPDTWTTGFFPATLYAMAERSALCPRTAGGKGQREWVRMGQAWSTPELPLTVHTGVGHDVGFLSFPFVNELEVHPGNKTAKKAVNAFAQELAARFSPIVGCTKSWDDPDPTVWTVIIDNMMNLEVLFQSEKLTGNHTLRHIAISHADKTMKNHIRPDGSSYHVVKYNATTGKVFWRGTSQGYADNSTWTRGQAWGIYGFANMHKNTGNPAYLETSRRIANFFLDHVPKDGIVPWDFNAPLHPPRPADSSAATIAANGLLLLAQQDPANSWRWTEAAIKLLSDTTRLAWHPSWHWQSVLTNGTVNNPAANNLTGIVYGDYYYITAANELVKRGLAHC